MKLAICVPICARGNGVSEVEQYLIKVRAHRDTKDALIFTAVMDYTPDDLGHLFDEYGVTGAIWRYQRIPLATNRREIIEKFRGDETHWLFHDDDIFISERTSYAEMMAKCMEPGTGCVSLNWRKAAPLCDRVELKDEFVEQPIVNIGGGMMFHATIADIVIPDGTAWMFDDAQYALNTYMAGLRNYRYLGGIAEHRIMGKGGLIKSYKEGALPVVLPDPKFVTIQRTTKTDADAYQGFYMYGGKDLTRAAHALHAKRVWSAARRRGGLL